MNFLSEEFKKCVRTSIGRIYNELNDTKAKYDCDICIMLDQHNGTLCLGAAKACAFSVAAL